MSLNTHLQPENISNGDIKSSVSKGKSQIPLPEMSNFTDNLQDLFQQNKVLKSTERVLRRSENMVKILESVSQKIARQFMTERMAHFIDSTVSENEMKYLEHQVHRARNYFVSFDENKLNSTPIEYLAEVVESLPVPQDDAEKAQFLKAQDDYARELVSNLFWQQLDNPVIFTSHGCDHAINVAEYSVDIVTQNPEVLKAAVNKYGITEAEAQLLFQHVALFHDCGYPHLEGKKKSAHPIFSHDIAKKINESGILRNLIRSISNDPKKAKLLESEVEHAIFFHGADKVEGEFGIEIETGPVGFLTADIAHLEPILRHFSEPNRLDITRTVTAIKTNCHATRIQIRRLLQSLPPELLSKIGIQENDVFDEQFLQILNEVKKGRVADLVTPGDQKIAFEYQDMDVLKYPFHLLRYADNMDATVARLSSEHRHVITKQFYTKLGDGGILSQQIQELTTLLDKFQQENSRSVGQTKSAGELLLRTQGLKEVYIRQMKNVVLKYIDQAASTSENIPDFSVLIDKKYEEPKDLEQAWRMLLLQSLAQHEVPSESLATIREICLGMPLPSLQNWAGCEPITHIELQGAHLIVWVNPDLFEELNQIKVQEFYKTHYIDQAGQKKDVKHEIRVGVGEYQIYRIEEAFRSLSFEGKQIQVVVLNNQNDQELQPTYREMKSNESIVQKLNT